MGPLWRHKKGIAGEYLGDMGLLWGRYGDIRSLGGTQGCHGAIVGALRGIPGGDGGSLGSLWGRRAVTGPLWGHYGGDTGRHNSGTWGRCGVTVAMLGTPPDQAVRTQQPSLPSAVGLSSPPRGPHSSHLGLSWVGVRGRAWGGLGGVWGSPPPQLLTLRRMMSISEYFMPFTRMGMSLQQGGGRG